MKRFTKYLALFLTGSLAALTACGPEMNEVDVQNNPVINSTTLSPMADESGSVPAYVGTEISVEGFNLDRVSHVTLGDLEAEITEKNDQNPEIQGSGPGPRPAGCSLSGLDGCLRR